MGINEILHDKKDEILRIAARHGARNLRVFGSVSRGDATADSDVDFLIDVGPVHSPWFPGGFIADLEDLLGRRVDVVTEDAIHWYIRDRVVAEAVPL